jgi:GT2 family glycosyltransferase
VTRRGLGKRIGTWRARQRLRWLGLAGRAARALGLRGPWYRHLASLVQGTGLFDAAWYVEVNPDVVDDGYDPLLHYVRHGDREGRQPMPLFDPVFYRQQPGSEGGQPNSLLHYALLGRRLKISTSAWFDVEYYLRQNRDVARAGIDPLRHYLEHGGFEGRSPCRQFDAGFYLHAHPAVRAAGLNPLIHYLRYGRYEGFAPVREAHAAEAAPVAVVARADWPAGPRRADVADAAVDVVVPVYRGLETTLRCLRSVLAAQVRTPYELVVVDDDSPEPDLVSELGQLAADGYFTLVRNASNLGFVRSANRGMELHASRDVVLLNSDTEVFGDWLDRLRAAAWRGERTATVTPLSNNATIASYPRFLHDNPYPLELGYAELDALAARVNADADCEVPTGVGFCMYLRRDCLEEIGLFDAESFGKGYGEENDLCQRAIGAGWRNLVAPGVFVHHVGSVSFQGERARRVSQAMHTLDRLHPGYQRDVRAFIREDPLAGARCNLDRARLGRLAGERSVLIVCHNRGGGAERHVREDTARLRSDGWGVFYLRPVHGVPGHVRIAHPRELDLPNLPACRLDDSEGLAALLAPLGVRAIHVHSTVDFERGAPDRLMALALALGAELEVEIHDYHVICPRTNLADEQGFYCGEPSSAGCNSCLATRGSRCGTRDIDAWRAENHRMLRGAARVWVPDADGAERLRRYFADVSFLVAPHEAIEPAALSVSEPVLSPEDPLRIAVIGAIGMVKGYRVLLECAREAKSRGLPLDFSLLGYSMNDASLAQAGVHVSGRYLEHEGMERLRAFAPHVAWLPSLWPETYSYTLSLALRAGLPVFAFDIGAIARRLGELGLAQFRMPLQMARRPSAVVETFLRYRSSVIAAGRGDGAA